MNKYHNPLNRELRKKGYKTEYMELGAQHEFARQVIQARTERGITQKQLAELVGTSQSNISKIEHAGMNPSFDMAQRIAQGLGKQLSVCLV